MTDTLRIEARFKNARLYNAIHAEYVPLSMYHNGRAAGPVKSFCDIHGLHLQAVYQLLNLRIGPIIHVNARQPNKSRVRPLCQQLAVLLGCEVEWLFPAELYSATWPALAFEVPSERMVPLLSAPAEALMLPPTQETELAQSDLSRLIHAQLERLKPREAHIIKGMYGMDGSEELSLTQIARNEGVSKERVRQIAAKAMRKLRGPLRSNPLREMLNG